MRRLLLIFLFSLVYFFSKSQTTYIFIPSEISNRINYTIWKVSGDPICGSGNAYCTINRSAVPNFYGNYEYYIYFASNSYYVDCQFTRTYIPDIYIYYTRNVKTERYTLPLNFFSFWITIGNTDLVYTLFHPSPNLTLKINVGKMEPTSY